MADGVEKEPANDKRDWRFRGPDKDGFVWFDWDGAGPSQTFNLGKLVDAAEGMVDWLASVDYGEK